MCLKPTDINFNEIRIFLRLEALNHLLDKKENRLVVQINHVSIKKENKMCSQSECRLKMALLKQTMYFATAEVASRATMVFGLSVNGGEPQCICNRIRTTYIGLKH